MRFKYSCADFTFPLLPHEKALHLIKLMDFDGVDLGIFENRSHNYPSHIARNPKREGERMRRILETTGLMPADVFLQTGAEPPIAAANSPDKAIRDNNRQLFLKILDFSDVIGCRHVTGLPGVFHPGENERMDWARACDETKWRLEQAKARNITYAVEPHMGSVLPDPDAVLEFMNDCPGLTLTLDYGHFAYVGIPDVEVHPLIPYASHFHARGGAKEKLQTMVRENEIDYKAIIPKLRQNDHLDYVCMEYVYNDWGDCNRTDNVSETLLLKELFERGSIS